MSYYVYFLSTLCKKRTYIGATIDLAHRLRQHNGEIRGGAKATAGNQWERMGYVLGFPDWRSALQFEWKWKNLTKKIDIPNTHIYKPENRNIERRIFALKKLLSLEKSTNNAIPFSGWGNPPIVCWENIYVEELWNKINNEKHFLL